MRRKPRHQQKKSILKGEYSYSTSYDSNPSASFENASFSSTNSTVASARHHSQQHGSSEHASEDDEGTVSLLQPKHGSESFEEEVTLDVDPLLPERTTDAAAASIVRLPPQAVAALPSAMAQTLAGRYEGSLGPRRKEVRFSFPDPMKFLFNDWHFSFIPKTPYVALPPLVAPPTSRRRHYGPSGKLSVTPVNNELLSPAPPTSLGGRSPQQPSSLPSRAPSRATPQSLVLQPPPIQETPPHPADVVEALELYMAKKTPHALTLEGLSFGEHPNALCYFFFSALSKNACGSLRKLHLPFCDITSRTLLLLVAGLENASRTTQHLLTEIDLSHNKLTQQSIPILTLLIVATKVLSLGLHGNKIGTAVLNGDATDSSDRDMPTPMPPRSTVNSSLSDKQQGRKAARGARLRRSTSMTDALLEKAKGTLAQFVVFVRDACPRLESLDVGFTNLNPDEQAVLITSIGRMTQLKHIALDGLKLTPNNAAKLAVAVVDSSSLWSVSVNYNTTCSSAQYQDKLRSHCDNRRILAHLPKLRRNTSFGGPTSSMLHLSTANPPGMQALMSKRNFLDLDNTTFVDDWAISEGYAKYTTNDPSLRKRK